MTQSKFIAAFVVCFVFNNFLFCQESKDTLQRIQMSKTELKAKKREIEKNKHLISFYAVNNQYPLIIKDPSLLLANEIAS